MVLETPLSSPYLPQAMAIREALRELADVFTFTFDTPGGFSFRPGQFNMLYLHGVGEVAISISGDPTDTRRLVHTIRAVGTVTRGMDPLGAGSVLGVRGPYGSSWPIEEARGRDVLFVAGGLGLAPLRPALLEVLARRADYGRVTLLYGARSPSELLFRRELERWRGRFDCRVEAIVDRAGRDWFGPVGVVTRLVANAEVGPDDTVFVCGPEIMMRFVVRELERRGVPDSSIWISMERNMKCGVGLCGHCQFGPSFVCKDGPVYRFDRVAPLFFVREL
jgi:NAD(P)H-flavin reductase